MNVDARRAGLIAATVPLAGLLFGATMLELIPRMILGGMLVFLGLSFIAEWLGTGVGRCQGSNTSSSW